MILSLAMLTNPQLVWYLKRLCRELSDHSLLFLFVPFNCDEKEAERFLMALRLHLNKKKQAKVVAKDHQASSSPSSLLSIPSVYLFFPF